MALTDLAIRQAKPQDKPYQLADGESLYLEVSPSGGKLWRFRFRFQGKAGILALGKYPAVGLSDARQKAHEARVQLAQGINPSQAKKEAKVVAQIAATNAFELVAREWHEKQLDRWTPDHARRVMDSLEIDAFPDLGKLPVPDLTAPLILNTILKIEKRGAVETAQRVLQRISAIIRFAIQTGRATDNPAVNLVGAIRAKKVEHRPALPRGELREFYRRLAAEPLYIPTRIAMHLLMLTFVRPGELRAARWEEFDEERAEWRIPAERMKMREPHLVPLSRQALELLKELRPLTGKSALLFPAVTDLKKPMSENTLGYAMGRMGYKGTATPHGFRALASTVLNEEGFDPDIIEKQLAHAERNKVRAAYHRAEYLEDRRKIMQWWADFLTKHSC
ncbi:integrase arm-type DNA-binding domain-containing protein [Chromobacterium sp. IIBBL 290-4]|uniref:tyrosine-type recombinase/integrase n=1 Tax=Chromobacterium sp. IIBBL 290-4 TaxID=2953890 RepID=UPI0020B74849|nr:integrase arm-type DNA-binding domain-containing protein [Chromobacterium sp. IIBBL 290-4]UTH76359.1 tyrosine-type recombinase/integrase [Chromobacterium sp. IIBBL 290-4]